MENKALRNTSEVTTDELSKHDIESGTWRSVQDIRHCWDNEIFQMTFSWTCSSNKEDKICMQIVGGSSPGK
jgi:hypothetical protein